MSSIRKLVCRKRQGVALIISMIFVLIFSALAVSMASLSGTNVQLATNQHKVNSALDAAQSGLECGKYLVATVVLQSTGDNTVSADQANTVWTTFCQYVQDTALDGQTVPAPTRFTDSTGSGDQLITPSIDFASTDAAFEIRFYRYDSDPCTIKLQSTGTDREVTKQIGMNMAITKDSEVLKYAIASRGKMWVTQNSTIYGPIFSTWNKPEWGAPVETTADTTVEGSINTVLAIADLENENIQMETLDANNNPVFDEYGNRVYSEADTVQGAHEGINYEVSDSDMPGMDEDDYDTSAYASICTDIPAASTTREYFPHLAGDYSQPRASWSKAYDRNVYENQTFTNAKLPKGRHALFRNCTFEGVLFIETKESYQDSTSQTNNVRFENCTFNGAIVTNVPSSTNHWSWWTRNVLYFTGEATFDNTSSMQETTILAPNFNVNLGNTGALDEGGGNVLTGAVIGGIVDVRGNAEIYGTIISMYDTSAHPNGYVTNIGAADDGGSEGAVYSGGTISITPSADQMLPSGITSPIVIQPQQNTYSEGL